MRDVPGVETVEADADTCVLVVRGSMRAADVLAAFTATDYVAVLLPDSGAQRHPRDGA